MAKNNLPVIVGVGQSVSHWDATLATKAPSPLSLATEASRHALANTGIDLAAVIDTLVMVRTNTDSIPRAPHPHGQNLNPPGTLARDLGAAPRRMIYTGVGGQCPQAVVNEIAATIFAGDCDVALIAGAEAIGASKVARKAGIELDWSDSADADFEDRGLGAMLLSRHEIKHGLVQPNLFYGLFETAIATGKGRSRSAHRAAMSDLFAPFSQVAANNPFAQFPMARSAEWLATPTPENYEIADPYLKWHIAQDAVNQGAAVVMMSEAKADALGIAKESRVYLHGGGEASDSDISQRTRLDGSWAMQVALSRALEQAQRVADDINYFDLYSCFPCAVTSACDVLGIDPQQETRPLTVTGGLPYFGGPGNNYSLHAIASMTERLRAKPGEFGLVLANGGWMTKEAAGVYSTQPPDVFTPVAPLADTPDIVDIAVTPESGRLESYTIRHGRNGPAQGYAACRTEDGRRFMANLAPEAMAKLREDICQGTPQVAVTTDGEINTITLA